MCCTEFVFCWLSPTLKTLWWAFSNVPPVLNFVNCECFFYFYFSILWNVPPVLNFVKCSSGSQFCELWMFPLLLLLNFVKCSSGSQFCELWTFLLLLFLNFVKCSSWFSILWNVNVSSSAFFFLSRWVRSLNCSSRTSVSMTRLQQNGPRGDHHHQHQHQH